MKKLVFLFALTGLALVSCGDDNCLTCEILGQTDTVCEADYDPADNDSLSWEQYVDVTKAAAAFVGGTCTEN